MNLIKQKIIEIVSIPPKKEGDTGYMKLTEKEIDKIVELFRETIQRFIEETKLIKMDYLKWQLRKDLTGRYHTIDLEKATERAKGWNAFKDKLNQKQAKWLKENL